MHFLHLWQNIGIKTWISAKMTNYRPNFITAVLGHTAVTRKHGSNRGTNKIGKKRAVPRGMAFRFTYVFVSRRFTVNMDYYLSLLCWFHLFKSCIIQGLFADFHLISLIRP